MMLPPMKMLANASHPNLVHTTPKAPWALKIAPIAIPCSHHTNPQELMPIAKPIRLRPEMIVSSPYQGIGSGATCAASSQEMTPKAVPTTVAIITRKTFMTLALHALTCTASTSLRRQAPQLPPSRPRSVRHGG